MSQSLCTDDPLSSCKRKIVPLQIWSMPGCWVSFRSFELSCGCAGTYVLKGISWGLWNSLHRFSKADLILAEGFQCGRSLYSQKHTLSSEAYFHVSMRKSMISSQMYSRVGTATSVWVTFAGWLCPDMHLMSRAVASSPPTECTSSVPCPDDIMGQSSGSSPVPPSCSYHQDCVRSPCFTPACCLSSKTCVVQNLQRFRPGGVYRHSLQRAALKTHAYEFFC